MGREERSVNYLSICSGIEAASCAFESLGWEPIGFSEIEPFPSAVLAHHYPHIPNYGDMRSYKEWNLGANRPQLIVGGPPCQSFSVAGLRKGISDDRGNLTLTYCDLVDHFDPEWVIYENVPGLLSSKDNAFGCFLAGLCGESEPLVPDGKWANAGVVSGPKRTIAWRILDAQYAGVAQRRRRVFVCAVRGAGNWAAPAALFPVGESMYWDSAPSRKARKDYTEIAGTLAASGGGLDRPAGNANELDFCVIQTRSHQVPTAVLQPMAFAQNTRDEVRYINGDGQIAGALAAEPGMKQTTYVHSIATHEVTGMAVRRLTPVEAARLQGFPDDYLDIEFRGKPAADGNKYKALGNSMAVPVMNWLGRRIQSVIDMRGGA